MLLYLTPSRSHGLPLLVENFPKFWIRSTNSAHHDSAKKGSLGQFSNTVAAVREENETRVESYNKPGENSCPEWLSTRRIVSVRLGAPNLTGHRTSRLLVGASNRTE